jgi:hypothetical protein
MPIKYADQTTDMNLGDRVWLRVWIRKRVSRVVYVPDISAPNPELEFNGMRWVGIRLVSKAGALKKKVRFIARHTAPCKFITPDSKEFEKHGSGIAV